MGEKKVLKVFKGDIIKQADVWRFLNASVITEKALSPIWEGVRNKKLSLLYKKSFILKNF